MSIFNILYVLCLCGVIASFYGVNFGSYFSTDRLRCALKHDLKVDVKINENGDAEEGAFGGSDSPETRKSSEFSVVGSETVTPEASGSAEILSRILKSITNKLSGAEELINLEDSLQRTVQTMFSNEGLRTAFLRHFQSSDSLETIRDLLREKYFTTICTCFPSILDDHVHERSKEL